MKFIPFRFLLFLSSIILLSSCLGTTTTPTVVSSDASFVSLTYVAKNKIPTVTATVFTLGDNNTIVNLDSLPYKASVDSVSPTFKFATSSKSVLYFKAGYKKDTLLANGTDTIDFRQLLRIRNYATDLKSYKDYYFNVNVHKVIPELYVWKDLGKTLNPQTATNQKTVMRNDSMFYYLNDGSMAYLFTSKDGITWNPQQGITGFPINTPLEDMIQFNGKFYVSQDANNIYSSSDGLKWSKKTREFTFKSLLFVLNNKLWAVVQLPDFSYHYASLSDGDNWDVLNVIFDVDFPVRGFSSLTLTTRTGKQKAIVLGGYSANNTYVKSNWSTEDGIYWINFSSQISLGYHSLDSLAPGASIISYDNKILLFGAVEKNSQMVGNYYRESIDEGLSWQKPDTLHNFLPKDFVPRNFQSVVVFKPVTLKGVQDPATLNAILQSNRIFIVGGKSGSTVFSDVWTGKLNRKNFLRQ